MKFCFLIIVLILPVILYGQSDYFVKDSIVSSGINIIDANEIINSKVCQVRHGKIVFKYSPFEVKQFGFKDGRTYVSKEIRLLGICRQVFLERLVKGRTTLYYYRSTGIKTFYLEKDNNALIELPKKNIDNWNYQLQLKDITNDCYLISEAIRHVNYKKRSLAKLISLYNKCEKKPFPHFRWGINFGYELALLNPTLNNKNEIVDYFDYKYDGGYILGVFIDQPVLVSDFSIHADFYMSKHGFSYQQNTRALNYDFVVNLTSLNVPLQIRYTYPTSNFLPFLNLGIMGVINLRNDFLLHSAMITDNKIEINDIGGSATIDNVQLGYCFGGGLEYRLNFKNSIFFEMRLCNTYGTTDLNLLNISKFKLLVGLNI